MTERERLIELLKENISQNISVFVDEWNTEVDIDFDKIADHLLTNGVIVPPCKVGDYVEWDNGLDVKTLYRVNGFYYNPDDRGLRYLLKDCSPIVNIKNITRIVPKEEAEKALKERSEGK